MSIKDLMHKILKGFKISNNDIVTMIENLILKNSAIFKRMNKRFEKLKKTGDLISRNSIDNEFQDLEYCLIF